MLSPLCQLCMLVKTRDSYWRRYGRKTYDSALGHRYLTSVCFLIGATSQFVLQFASRYDFPSVWFTDVYPRQLMNAR